MSTPGTVESRRTDFFDLPGGGGHYLPFKGVILDPDEHARFLTLNAEYWRSERQDHHIDPSELIRPDIADTRPPGGQKD